MLNVSYFESLQVALFTQRLLTDSENIESKCFMTTSLWQRRKIFGSSYVRGIYCFGGGRVGKELKIWRNKVIGRVLGNPMRGKGGAGESKPISNTAEFPSVFYTCSDQSNLE